MPIVDDAFDAIDLDLDEVFSSDSEEITSSEVFDLEKPHWSVSREEMIRVLRTVLTFPAKSTVFFAIQKKRNGLQIHSNNKDAVLNSVLPILNEDPYDTDRIYFLDAKVLLSFIQTYSKFAFSFDEQGSIYFESPYSVYKLENYALNYKEVCLQIESEEQLNWVDSPLTRAQWAVFNSLFGFAIKLTNYKLLITDSKVEAFFTLYQHTIYQNTGFSDKFVLRRGDLPTIVNIAYADLQMAVTDDRVYFKFPLGVVSFLKIPYQESDFNYPESFASGDKVGEFQVDIKQLRRALKLTAVLGTSLVEFRSEGDSILLYATESAKFIIGQGKLNSEFSLNTDLFTRLVATIDVGEVFVQANVSEKGVDFEINKDKKLLYSLSRTTSGQLARQEKRQNKIEMREVRRENLASKGKLSDNIADSLEGSIADLLMSDL
jgi:hypothetical protein